MSSPHGLARHVICSQYMTTHMTHIVTPAAAADGATEKATDRAPAEQGMSADVIARIVTEKVRPLREGGKKKSGCGS